MSSMTDERYNGYANRETWAFNLHWQNDQGLYGMVLEAAQDYIDGQMQDDPDREMSDRELGEQVVIYVQELLAEMLEDWAPGEESVARMMRDEVGSWWRIDHAEVGAAVRESLDAESD